MQLNPAETQYKKLMTQMAHQNPSQHDACMPALNTAAVRRAELDTVHAAAQPCHLSSVLLNVAFVVEYHLNPELLMQAVKRESKHLPGMHWRNADRAIHGWQYRLERGDHGLCMWWWLLPTL